MNKFKVGQRVKIKATGKQGKILDVDQDDDINCYGSTNLNYYVSFKNNDSLYYYFFTVHDLEEVKDILDKEEKEYLSNIIKPFRDRVNLIRKSHSKLADDIYYKVIEISIKSLIPYWENEVIVLPAFKSDLYSDMEIGKEYTLEELGL